MIFESRLERLIDETVAVVMVDGNCYKGRLIEYDSDTVVLREVEETTNDEVCWKEPGEDGIGPACDERRGYLIWHKVALPEALLRVQGILRVWPWEREQPESGEEHTAEDEGGEEGEEDDELPIYLSPMISFG